MTPSTSLRNRPRFSARRARFFALLLGSIPAGRSAHAAADIQMTPESWAEGLLDRCLDQRERWERSLSDLELEILGNPASAEDTAFPGNERKSFEKSLARERARYFGRLNYLLLGDQFWFREETTGRFRSGARGGGESPFGAELETLFGDSTPCELEAFQATVLFAYFGVPFALDRLQSVRDEEVIREVEHAFHHHGETSNGEDAYVRLRESTDPEALRYVDEMTVRLAGVASSQVALLRAQTPPVDLAAQTELNYDLRSALDRPHANPIRRRVQPEDQAELDKLVRFMNLRVRLALEPARIRTYLHAKVDDLEGALRTNVPDPQFETLQERVESAFFGDHESIVLLPAKTPKEILDTVTPILDRWMQEEALPAIEKRLYGDPFSAYWYFVQTGFVARLPHAFEGSRVSLEGAALSLDALRKTSTADVVHRLGESRIPERFLDAHEELEGVLRDVTLSREEALQVLDSAPLLDEYRTRLRAYLSEPGESEEISTTDVYRWIIRDANRFEGHVNWDLVDAALELLRAAKQELLEDHIEQVRVGGGDPTPDALGSYLRNAGNLMLELETRQAREGKFQQGTGGGLVGWTLGRFAIGDAVPIQLWIPEGVTGGEFTELMNELTPKNGDSGRSYSAKSATSIRLVHDGREYYEATVRVIDGADQFLNISAFDWKRDKGGKEITYRLMAKKLDIDGDGFQEFEDAFAAGLPLSPEIEASTSFYDIPSQKMKNLLIYHFFRTTAQPEIRSLREDLERLLDNRLRCATVATCGDLSFLWEIAGEEYVEEAEVPDDPARAKAWEAFRRIQTLFKKEIPSKDDVRRRQSLADYLGDGDDLRRFVSRYGARRADEPQTPLPIHIIVDGKQSSFINASLGFSTTAPFFLDQPVDSLYMPLFELGVELVLWKGVMEFPWHLGPIPIPGRKIAGKVPMPFIPYPWLSAVPGFGWAGVGMSLFLQFALATDPREWWAMVTHTKHCSNESMGLESGMGLGSKYFNEHPDFKTWHDMGVFVEGPIVDDLNDHFVQVFNQARTNNAGIAASRGLEIEELDYAAYRTRLPGPADDGELVNTSWVVTTHPETGDFNYRAVLLSAIAAARENIYLESSFFSDPLVPRMLIRKAREFRGRVTCEGLDEEACSARKREAVDINVILPGASDKPIIDVIGASDFHEMLHLGIKLYRWDPPQGWSASAMLHTKAWLVDYRPGAGGLTYVGSSNATQRSHIQDNEVGIVSTSADFADEVYTRLFLPDMKVDSRVEIAENFHVVLSTDPAIRAGRWFRRFLVDFLWVI